MSRRGSQVQRPHPWRRRLVLGAWLISAAAISVRAGQIQIMQGAQWRGIASGQQQEDQVLPAPRGTILDREGTPLSVTRERNLVNIAPGEVRDVEAVRALLTDVLDVSTSRALRLASSGRGWNAAGLHPPAVRDRLEGTAGVYVDRVFQRYYPHGDLARGVLGVVLDDEGRGGVESEFERWLSGRPGRQVVARDNVGAPIPGDQVTVEPPQAGGEIVLTLDMDLQEIAQEALLDAVAEHEARGGDILITDPRTGEVLALFSTQDGQAGALSAVNTPFEPGSTLKPFTVAGLLKHDLASLQDTVDTGDGTWVQAGRELSDTHTEGRMTIREALRESSNVGIAKAALPMTPGVQYENLRDFGFGTLTGLGLGESAGTLRRPEAWTGQSPASLAIGYEISVTALQMAMAYGALANGGLLMRPQLVRELRNSDGSVAETFEPQVLRRVVDAGTAGAIGRALVDVVEDGTGTSARLGSFQVAGKSGTARYNSGSGYAAGEYSSSFVGYFPADNPQLVVFVKLDRPQGQYYGGAVAAPVTRATMEAALAANSAHLDRRALLESSRGRPGRMPADLLPSFASSSLEPAVPPFAEALEWIDGGEPISTDGLVTLPDVSGLPARVAVRHLHRLGLRVAQVSGGSIVRSMPIAGSRVLPGDTIRLRYRGPVYD
jgi:cell division protein FtsI (penicillin-binding protein 3)